MDAEDIRKLAIDQEAIAMYRISDVLSACADVVENAPAFHHHNERSHCMLCNALAKLEAIKP